MAAALIAAGWIYHWAIAGEDRYSIFDLAAGRPVTAVLGQAQPAPTPTPTQTQTPAPAEKPAAEAPASPAPTKPGPSAPAPAPESVLSPEALNSTQLLEKVNLALADLTDRVVPSVVSIDTTKTVDVPSYVPVDPFGFFGYRRSNQRYQVPSLGSGVIVSEDGHILTNHHVVAGVDEIRVTTFDGAQFQAEWVGSDPTVDVAVLKIKVNQPEGVDGEPPRRFPALRFGDSDGVRVGDMALAVGNPFGLSETVTRGIISAKQRQLSDGSNEYFQTDAVINPGNSGGPLVDVHGEIIGINSAIFTGQQDVRVWQGIGLAIPSNEAREVYDAIVFDKPLLRGYLGVYFAPELTRQHAMAAGLRSLKGALVTNVDEQSPAQQAGLKPGDVIVSFNGAEATTAADTLNRIRRLKAGEQVKLGVFRQGQTLELRAVIAERPDTTTLELKSEITASGQAIAESLGVAVRDLTAAERSAFGLDADSPAIVITEVKPGSEASQRFLAGDLIHAINRNPVRTAAEFHDLLGSLPKREQSVIILSRRGHRFYAVLNPGR